jgi:hypothetical protein
VGRLFIFVLLFSFAAVSQGTVPGPHKATVHAKTELAAAANNTLQTGFDAELPPHVSTLLGLTSEEKCAVKQGLLRSGDKIQGIEVTEKDHNDIVIFVVDEAAKSQTFYLTSPAGQLRKVLTVKQGLGQVVRPTKADLESFEKEKKLWKERQAAAKAAK